jgi:hypothetical protein
MGIAIIEGGTSAEALAAALHDVARRHEILRTGFGRLSDLNVAVQFVTDEISFPIEQSDLSLLRETEQRAKIDHLIDGFRSAPFNISNAPLLRSLIATLSPMRHLLVIALPSLCADAAAVKNFIDEIIITGAAFQRGQSRQDVSIQYADFSEWQNQLVESPESNPAKEYWEKLDITPPAILSLPFEMAAGDVDFCPRHFDLDIDAELADKVRRAAVQLDVSEEKLLLAACFILIHRVTGQTDIIIAFASDGRNYEELERAIGLHTKYLPMRVQMD